MLLSLPVVQCLVRAFIQSFNRPVLRQQDLKALKKLMRSMKQRVMEQKYQVCLNNFDCLFNEIFARNSPGLNSQVYEITSARSTEPTYGSRPQRRWRRGKIWKRLKIKDMENRIARKSSVIRTDLAKWGSTCFELLVTWKTVINWSNVCTRGVQIGIWTYVYTTGVQGCLTATQG